MTQGSGFIGDKICEGSCVLELGVVGLAKQPKVRMSNKRTFEQTVAELTAVHGGKYSYRAAESGSVYITCPAHGEYLGNVYQHKRGFGCAGCANEEKRARQTKPLEYYVEAARRVHGDRYTYKALLPTGKEPKLLITCPDHGDFEQARGNHLKGAKCPVCAKARVPRVEFVERAKLVHGDKYEYLGITTKGRKNYFTLRCKKHGEFEQEASNHLAGKGCKKCAVESATLRQRYTLEEVIRAGRQLGFDYDYQELNFSVPVSPTVKYVCGTHGEVVQNLYNHLAGKRCERCANEGLRLTFDEAVQRSQAVHGGKYTYLELLHEPTRLRILCKEHGEFVQLTSAHISDRCGCPVCGKLVKSEKAMWNLAELQAELPQLQILEVELQGGKTVATLACDKHGEWTRTTDSLLRGRHSCPRCSQLISRGAQEVAGYLESLGLVVQLEAKVPNSNLRWDIYVPSLQFAIEFHGAYWHSEKYRDSGYHKYKHELSGKAGVRLLQIFDFEWETRQQQIKALLRNISNTVTDKVAARKTELTEVSATVANTFMNTYHIQGQSTSSRYIGLTHLGNLVAVLGYATRRTGRGRANDATQLEITRFASSVRVVGGFTKLLKALLKKLGTVKKVSTFSDDRVFDGKLYAAAGFTASGKVLPNYFYIHNGRPMHKASLQKSRIKANPKLVFIEGKTEKELAELNGFQRVWDAGKTRWTLDL